MAQVQRKLVHKQFNSPIGLYSDNNVKATLDRELKVLSNGTMGINFDDTAKPANLANSAVLRMLEEEEAQRRGYQAGLKRVAWPPEQEGTPVRTFPQSQPSPARQQQPLPATLNQQHQNQYQPTSQPTQAFQQPSNQPTSYEQQFQQLNQDSQQPVYYQPVVQQKQNFEAPPQDYQYQPNPSINSGVITLRKEAPVSQKPAPVFISQPAALSFGGGGNMLGDQKWPPIEYKRQAEIENEERRKLALGPAFRPRKVQKDYSQFFGQHALNSTYAGYRPPPGTQHYPIKQT